MKDIEHEDSALAANTLEPATGLHDVSDLFINLSEYEHDAERDWFAEGAIEGACLVVWGGPEKTGKSWILGDLIVATVTGGKWLHRFQLSRAGRVMLLETENQPRETNRRLRRLARAHGANPDEVIAGVDYYGQYLHLDDDEMSNHVRELERAFRQFEHPALIVIDPLRGHMLGNEDSAADIRKVVEGANRLRQITPAPVVIAHHLNKSGGLSGSRALSTGMDLIITGTDGEQPEYNAVGRRIRDNDPIANPFVIDIEHENDDDDTAARTFCRARFKSERATPAAEIGRPARRLLDLIKKSKDGVTHTEMRNVLKLNGPARTKAIQQLVDKGLIVQRDGRCALATASFLKGLS